MNNNNDLIIGAKIVGVTWLTAAEAKKQGIPNYDPKFNPVQKIVLDNGKFLTALADPEGNGSGFMIMGDDAGGSWYING